MEIILVCLSLLLLTVILTQGVKLILSFRRPHSPPTGSAKKYSSKNIDRYTTTLRLTGLATTLLFLLISFEMYATKEPQQPTKVLKPTDFEVVDYVEEESAKEAMPAPQQSYSVPPPPTPDFTEVVENEYKRIPLTVTNEKPAPIVMPQPSIPRFNLEQHSVVSPPPPPAPKVVDKPIENEIHELAERMPVYPGGINALRKEVASNYRIPNEIKQKAGFKATIVTRFVVTEQGTIGRIDILKSVAGCKACDEQAIQAIRNLSNQFEPGKQAGKPVSVWYTLPIVLTIR